MDQQGITARARTRCVNTAIPAFVSQSLRLYDGVGCPGSDFIEANPEKTALIPIEEFDLNWLQKRERK